MLVIELQKQDVTGSLKNLDETQNYHIHTTFTEILAFKGVGGGIYGEM